MDQSTDRGVRESSKVIKSNVFYVPEYRETILSQLLNFDELKMSRFVYILLQRCLLDQKIFHHKYKQRNIFTSHFCSHHNIITKYYSSPYKLIQSNCYYLIARTNIERPLENFVKIL